MMNQVTKSEAVILMSKASDYLVRGNKKAANQIANLMMELNSRLNDKQMMPRIYRKLEFLLDTVNSD